MKAIGTHYIWDIYDVDPSLISYVDDVHQQMELLNSYTLLTKLGQKYKQFDPIGVTGILLLSESHMSIHTWPEHRYAAIDIFSCKELDHTALTSCISKLYQTDQINFSLMERGLGMNIAIPSR